MLCDLMRFFILLNANAALLVTILHILADNLVSFGMPINIAP